MNVILKKPANSRAMSLLHIYKVQNLRITFQACLFNIIIAPMPCILFPSSFPSAVLGNSHLSYELHPFHFNEMQTLFPKSL